MEYKKILLLLILCASSMSFPESSLGGEVGMCSISAFPSENAQVALCEINDSIDLSDADNGRVLLHISDHDVGLSIRKEQVELYRKKLVEYLDFLRNCYRDEDCMLKSDNAELLPDFQMSFDRSINEMCEISFYQSYPSSLTGGPPEEFSHPTFTGVFSQNGDGGFVIFYRTSASSSNLSGIQFYLFETRENLCRK